MSLYDYLSKYFPSGEKGVFESQPVDLIEHFFDKFGVHVKKEGKLFLFKYDQLAAKFSYELVKECRGHIWEYNGVWTRVSNPPDKFFNQHEGYCPIFHNEEFVKRLPSLSAKRKEDGSAIQVYFYDGSWRVSTLGAITTFNVGDYPIKFDELFWKTVGDERKEKFIKYADKKCTYIFELCCSENRIVTKYKENTLFLLVVRDNVHSLYHDISVFAEQIGVAIPDMFLLASEGISTLDELARWVDKASEDTADVQYREGFVIYDSMTPIAKIKTSRYLSLHHLGGGDLGCTRNAVIECFFAGTLDDVWGVLHDSMKEFAEGLKVKVANMCNTVYVAAEKIDPTSISSQKDYALWVKANIPPQFSGFFFQNKDAVLAKKDIREEFSFWVKNNYKKYDSTWKS